MRNDYENVKPAGDLWKQILAYDVLDSTNIEAKRYLAEHADADGVVITCEQQTEGRGRRGRTWVSPAGSGIWMSMVLQPEVPMEKAPMLTLIAGMAVRKAIQECFQVVPQIKWPNDIILNDRKVCGILTEMRGSGVIVGIGVNVEVQAFHEELKEVATSIALETGIQKPDRAMLLKSILEYFEQYYKVFQKTMDLSGLVDEYNAHCINIGKRVRVIEVQGEYTAEAAGIEANGELVVISEDGVRKSVGSGEVTIRGVMGYAR